MREAFFVFAFPAIILLLRKKANPSLKKNIDAVHVINKAIETGDMSMLDSVIAADVVDHSGEGGEVRGLDNLKAEFTKMRAMNSEMKMDVIRDLADSDYVASWMRFRGTSTVAMGAMPAGTHYNMTAIELSRFKDGKAVEHWEFMEPSEMMKMMGQPANMNESQVKPDSSLMKNK